MGKSGRAMIEALLADDVPPDYRPKLARDSLKKKHDLLVPALTGRLRPHHKFMLFQQLQVIDGLTKAIAEFDERIAECTRPFEEAAALVQTMRGVARRTSECLIAEIGVDMSRFPTANHLTSWARICPGNDQSGGRRLNAGIGKGNTGSNPPSSKRPGQPHDAKTATTRHCFIASKLAEGQTGHRRRSALDAGSDLAHADPQG